MSANDQQILHETQQASHIRGITSGNIWSSVILYALPLMAASLFQQLYTLVDAYVVGNFVNSTALGAIDSASAITRILIEFFIGLSVGASIVIGQLWGAKKEHEVTSAVHAAFLLSVVSGIIVMVAGLALSDPLLRILNTPAENWDYAYTFIMIYFIGTLPMLIYNMCAAIMRAVGDSRRPFYFIVVSTLLNIALDLLFVAAWGWGVTGAAAATVIAETVSCILSIITLVRYKGACHLILRGVPLDGSQLKRMVLLGLPTGVSSALVPISNATVQWGINSLGSTVVTGWALEGKVDLFIWLIMDSLGVAATTFTAQCVGAGLKSRARKSFVVCLVYGAIFLIPISILLYFFGADAATIFANGDIDALAVCDSVFKFMAPWYIVFIPIQIFSGTIRGTGETLRPMLIVLFGTCILRILWMVLVVPTHLELDWVLMIFPISWIVVDIAFLLYWRFGAWRTRITGPDTIPGTVPDTVADTVQDL